MVTPTNHVIARVDLHAQSPWHFGDFRNILLPNLGEDQKRKALPFERGAPGTLPFGKSGIGYCITFIKILDKGLMLQLLGKILNFYRVVYLNWLAKIELRRPGSPSRQYCC